MSMPAETPALVSRSPSSTNRALTSVITVGSSSESRLSEAQCVVAERPLSRPADAYTRLPVHTEAISSTASRWARTQSRWAGVVEQSPDAVATGVDQDVQGGCVLEGVVRAQDEVLRSDDVHPARRQTRDAPTVLRMVLSPVGKDLPGADDVQFPDPVEEQQPDVAQRRRIRDAHGVWVGCVLHVGASRRFS